MEVDKEKLQEKEKRREILKSKDYFNSRLQEANSMVKEFNVERKKQVLNLKNL